MTHATTLQTIEESRAIANGYDAEAVRAGGCHVVAYNGVDAPYFDSVRVMRLGNATTLIVPKGLVSYLRSVVADLTAADACSVPFLQSLFGDAVIETFGPAWVGFADISDFVPPPDASAWRLDRADHAALSDLRNACAADDWEYSGIMEEHEPVFGVFDGSQLVAAASMGAWYEHLRFAGVITHPEHRGRGNGLAAAAAITAHGLMQGHIMQWHTHMTNEPSLRIARRLGYQQVYEAVGVRLLTESRPFPQTAAPVLERWAEAQAQRESPVMPSTTESAPTLFA